MPYCSSWLLVLAISGLSSAWVSSGGRSVSQTACAAPWWTSSTSTTTAMSMASTKSTSASSTLPDYAEIIGVGRIGSLLADAGNCRLRGRSDSIDPELEGTPIFIATRNDALDGIFQACPENRRSDLVFLQNGYLENFLARHGLQENTQVLLYVSVTAKGAPPIDGVTTVNPEGLTTATGKHAHAFARRLEAMRLKCNVVSYDDYKPNMYEKLIWISTYMLVGTAKDCSSVGQAGADYKDLVETVIAELVQAVCQTEGVVFADGVMARLAAYTEVVADFPCAVKEFEWRNEYFYKLGDDTCPTHNGLLRECAAAGKLSFELPP